MILRRTKGFTIAELMVVIAVVSLLGLVAASAHRLFWYFQRETVRLKSEREAQIAMYRILLDLRNAKRVVSILPDQVQFRAFNFRRPAGYDFEDSLGNPSGLGEEVNVGTVTYRYDANNNYLVRTSEFGTSVQEEKMCRNVLLAPGASGSGQEMFTCGIDDPLCAARDMVQILMRLRPTFKNDTPSEYREQMYIRGSGAS